MKKPNKRTIMKILPMVFVLFWTGCEDLDFPDPNNPTSDTATIQSLVTGAEAQMRSGFGVWIRDLLVVGREAYYLEPADPRYTGISSNCALLIARSLPENLNPSDCLYD